MGNFRIQILSPDGEVLNIFGEPGRRPGNLMRPKGIAIDSENHIYVVDAWFNNIQIFDIYGRVYLAFGSPGVNPGEFILPIGIYIDKNDRIYVLDQLNRRLQIFQYIRSGEKAPLPE
jgi:DNA-binding beta-propeller fold protein YncE